MLDLLAVQGTLKSLLLYCNQKTNSTGLKNEETRTFASLKRPGAGLASGTV